LTLPAIQQRLQAFLLEGKRDIEQHLIATERVPVATRLAIYGNAYRARLTEALATNYPALAQLLGAADFGSLAAAYIATHVSRWPSIRHYGGELPSFLASAESYRDAPLLAELAAWEWAMSEIFDAQDREALDAEALARIPPQHWHELRFDVHPASQRLDLSWNAPQIWKVLTGGGERPAPRLAAGSQPWLLWRNGLQILFRSLDRDEAMAFDALRAGATFGDMCLALCGPAGEAQAPVRAATCLRSWVESGLIVATRRQEVVKGKEAQ
jgi:hypothetical protein